MSADTVGKLRLRIIVPITEWQDRYATVPWMIALDPEPASGLSKPSAADAFQVRSVSLDRMITRLGALPEETLDAIAAGIALCVGHHPPS